VKSRSCSYRISFSKLPVIISTIGRTYASTRARIDLTETPFQRIRSLELVYLLGTRMTAIKSRQVQARRTCQTDIVRDVSHACGMALSEYSTLNERAIIPGRRYEISP